MHGVTLRRAMTEYSESFGLIFCSIVVGKKETLVEKSHASSYTRCLLLNAVQNWYVEKTL